jgi:hypothetical protein
MVMKSDATNEDGEYHPNLKGKIDYDGDRVWTDSKGDWHREDGPAIVWEAEDLDNAWFINGQELLKDEYIEFLKSDECTLDQKTILKLILENT